MANQSHEAFAPRQQQRSISKLLEPLQSIPQIDTQFLGPIEWQGTNYCLPRLKFWGPNSNEPIRIGLFAAIHGDEPAGAEALVRFLHDLAQDPEPAARYHLYAYPVCNPTGYEDNTRTSRRGRDLNREFWRASQEPEVCLLEHELRTRHFHGIIQLHADDTSDGLYGYVRGATLTENLLRPALLAAGTVLPRNINALIDGFAARDGIIYDHYDGVLAAPAAQVEPTPFEIILETPHLAPLEQQVEALIIAIRTILAEYRQVISFAQNI
jgi:hypothetical protein